MKKLLTRVLVLVFIVATISAFFAPAAGAIAAQNKRQQAVVETAIAYFNRGQAVQYESIELTDMVRDGSGVYANQRESEGRSPEDATMSDQMYSVCSAFCWEVYHDALGIAVMDYQLFKTAEINRLPVSDPMVVYHYSTEDKDDPRTLQQAVTEAWKIMQPGDIINSGDPSGHAMMFVGDILGNGTDYIIHCAGGKYVVEKGKDSVETAVKNSEKSTSTRGGAIKREPAYNFCFDLSGRGGYDLTKHETFTILRPLNVFTDANAPITANAQARMTYKGINIDRQATKTKHQSVAPGEEITVTINIENCGKEAFTVPVTEVVPENAALKSGSVTGGGTASGKNIKWTVTVEPGKIETMSYTVTATGKRGDVIRLEGGNVAGIRSNSIPVTISGVGLTEAQLASLQDINSTANRALLNGKGYTGIEFANAVYENLLGMAPNMVGIDGYRKNVIDRQSVKGAKSRMMMLKAAEDASFNKYVDMIIPSYIGGTAFYAPSADERLMHWDPQYTLQAGDVVLMNKKPYSGGVDQCYVALGNGKVAYLADDKVKVADAKKTIEPIFSYEFFVGLRPTLAYDDLSKVVAEKKLPFSDVKESDWFYTFVKELYTTGVVAGQTATTFAPNNNLTYGAALKLLVVGLTGKDPGNASGHWAANYLAEAKAKGWTTIDTAMLDKPITREAFCEIAAKAGNLTEQAENKFTDTKNPAVLALVKAGVINGMSETTFAPNNILTRAQISKIISLLLKL